MKRFTAYICISLLLPTLSLGQESPEPTIHLQADNGYWGTPSTWAENRIPTEDDIVSVDKTVRLKGTFPVVRGLIIEAGGVVRGRNQYYRGGITTTDYLKNNGSIGGYIYSVEAGGVVINNGIINTDEFYIRGGDLSMSGTFVIAPKLRGDIFLTSDMILTTPLHSGGRTIYSNNHAIQLHGFTGGGLVTGSSTIHITGDGNEQVRIEGLHAYQSAIVISSDSLKLLGGMSGSTIALFGPLYLDGADQTITGDITLKNNASIYGDSWRLRHGVTFDGSVTNFGTLGPFIFPTISGDLINLGSYTGNEITLSVSGEKKIVGSIPAEVRLAADQTWLTSPTIFGLQTNNHTLTLSPESVVQTTNILSAADIQGSGTLTLVNPLGNDTYSANIQKITAPDATVMFENTRGRIAGDIIAKVINIVDDIFVTENVELSASQVAFIGGSITGYGSSRNYQVHVDTPDLRGSGHLGPYTDIRFNTDIPLGFTSSGQVHLEHTGAGWKGTYRLAGTISSFMSTVWPWSDPSGPNLAAALNSGEPHLYNYEGLLGWTDVFSINNGSKEFETSSDIEKQNFFDFSFIADSSLSEPTMITITTPDAPTFSGRVGISAKQGSIYPHTIYIENGFWTGRLELFDEVLNQEIIATGLGTYSGHSGRSNKFAVSQTETFPGIIQGVVRNNDASRVSSGRVVFNNSRGDESYSEITSLGEYQSRLPCGEYLVSTTGYKNSVVIPCLEVVTHDITIRDECHQDGTIPVLLVPGITGSAQKNNDGWFPQLYSYIPLWDSGDLVAHNPKDIIGFDILTEHLENQGYQKNCTVFEVPYEWSLSIVDSAEQYLKPWINHAKKVASTTEVDIVAHSMGGLVARAYIQGSDYEHDVRKLAMAGTPNMGSTQAYFIWEGGDPMAADAYAPYSLVANFFQSDKYYTNTINANALIKTGSDISCKKNYWFDFAIFDIVFGENDLYACDKNKIKDFVQIYAPSLGELFPTYEFLYNEESQFIQPLFENSVVRSLNNQTCTSSHCVPFTQFNERGVESKLFIGEMQTSQGEPAEKTAHKVFVDEEESSDSTYSDGGVIGVTFTSGDGTVIVDSVRGIDVMTETFNSLHASIIRSAYINITNFLTK